MYIYVYDKKYNIANNRNDNIKMFCFLRNCSKITCSKIVNITGFLERRFLYIYILSFN